MNLKDLQKPLELKDIDFRIQSINKGGYATILAYKDARVDMNRLDDVCGFDWQKDYKTIDGRLYCGIGIKQDDEWRWRWDVGTESYTEKEKGQASDSFKRAGFCWGIGRELYDFPVIQIKLKSNEFRVENNKVYPTYELKLRDWRWCLQRDDSGITYLGTIDNNNELRFKHGEHKES